MQETSAELRRLRIVLLSDDAAGLGLAHLPDLPARYVLPEIDKDAITQCVAAVPGKPPRALLRRDIEGARHGEPDAGAALRAACVAGPALRISSPHPG